LNSDGAIFSPEMDTFSDGIFEIGGTFGGTPLGLNPAS